MTERDKQPQFFYTGIEFITTNAAIGRVTENSKKSKKDPKKSPHYLSDNSDVDSLFNREQALAFIEKRELTMTDEDRNHWGRIWAYISPPKTNVRRERIDKKALINSFKEAIQYPGGISTQLLHERPLGRIKKKDYFIDENGVFAGVSIPNAETKVWQQINDKILRGLSVGFYCNWGPGDYEFSESDDEDWDLLFKKIYLIEVSIVDSPAIPGCFIKHKNSFSFFDYTGEEKMAKNKDNKDNKNNKDNRDNKDNKDNKNSNQNSKSKKENEINKKDEQLQNESARLLKVENAVTSIVKALEELEKQIADLDLSEGKEAGQTEKKDTENSNELTFAGLKEMNTKLIKDIVSALRNNENENENETSKKKTNAVTDQINEIKTILTGMEEGNSSISNDDSEENGFIRKLADFVTTVNAKNKNRVSPIPLINKSGSNFVSEEMLEQIF